MVDWDISEKTVLITGANSGIGKALAEKLAEMGAKIIIHCRSEEKCVKTREYMIDKTGNSNVSYVVADLSSMKQVVEMTEEITKNYRELHVLINNAGVFNDKRKITVDGFDETLAVNYLAPFLLTNRLSETLKANALARVINVTSELYKRGEIHFDDLNLSKNWSGMRAYAQSKLALTMFTFELADRLKETGVTANCFSPGLVRTNLGSKGGYLSKISWRIVTLFGRSPEKGAETGVYLATNPELMNITGKHFKDLKVTETIPITLDKSKREKLWKITVKLLERYL